MNNRRKFAHPTETIKNYLCVIQLVNIFGAIQCIADLTLKGDLNNVPQGNISNQIASRT